MEIDPKSSYASIERGDEESSLCFGRLPGRKHMAIYCVRNNTAMPLAYFVSEEAEAEFERIVFGRRGTP